VAAAVILLGDQPGIRPAVIRAAVERWRRTHDRVVRAVYRGRPGHPVVLDRAVWAEVMAERGDRGARDVLADHPEWIVPLERDEDAPTDVDTPGDYERLIGGS
jgi:molybdenum cofactor cytidylyltransferase